jgi:hypothetical protein
VYKVTSKIIPISLVLFNVSKYNLIYLSGNPNFPAKVSIPVTAYNIVFILTCYLEHPE